MEMSRGDDNETCTVPTKLRLTFFTVSYLEEMETKKKFGPITVMNNKTKRGFTVPFTLFGEIMKKMSVAMDRCNNSSVSKYENTLICESRFRLSQKVEIALQVSVLF